MSNRSSKKKHFYKEKDLRKEYTLYGDVESRHATTSVLADYRVAADQHSRPLRHHHPPSSWRMNRHPHKPFIDLCGSIFFLFILAFRELCLSMITVKMIKSRKILHTTTCCKMINLTIVYLR